MREHDLVLFGATGFVGELTAAYLAEHAPAEARIALAGRSRAKLEAVRGRLPANAAGWALVEADSGNAASLAALAASTTAVATTVGPYARHGMPLVAACAGAGTHYADLTGEALFVREAIDRYDATARESGAKIVHSCGYDSIPSDLAAYLLHQRAVADGSGGLTDVQLVARFRGGVSGGTVDSMRGHVAELRDPARRKLALDPFTLSPDRAAEPVTRQPGDIAPPGRAADGSWTAPFVMAAYNTRIVRRSNALFDWAYGRGFAYSEVMGAGKGVTGAATAVGIAGGLGVFFGAMLLPPTRLLLDRVLPAPGEGPDAATRARGWFRSVVTASTETGSRYQAVAAGPGDPGYAATAVMLGESALALALDTGHLPERAGSLTPATAMGDVLAERLRKAGHTYEVRPF